jgi:hypothetical protein
MGNSTAATLTSGIMKEYEYNTGQKLLRAIKANTRTQMQECMDTVREEIKSQSKTTMIAHDKEYDNMIKVTLYFTRGYDVGDGVIFTKTPLQYAEQLKSDQAIDFINRVLADLSRNDVANTVMVEKGAKVVTEQSFMGKVDKDRVQQAKDRLKAFQNDRQINPKRKT